MGARIHLVCPSSVMKSVLRVRNTSASGTPAADYRVALDYVIWLARTHFADTTIYVLVFMGIGIMMSLVIAIRSGELLFRVGRHVVQDSIRIGDGNRRTTFAEEGRRLSRPSLEMFRPEEEPLEANKLDEKAD